MRRVAIVGSRGLDIDVAPYVPDSCEVIVSDGADGIDTCAAEYARAHGKKLIEIRPNYAQFGRGAPLRRNTEIVERADLVLAFWDGRSKGTKDAITKARARGKPCKVYLCSGGLVVAEQE